MKAIDSYTSNQIEERKDTEVNSAAMQRCAERIWNAISKYVTIEKDGIFKDPDWPHLWDKK